MAVTKLIRAGTGRRGRDHAAIEDALDEALREYADHQSWRCQYPDRYWEGDECPCGLTAFQRRARGLLDA